jgi:hypothetical protein
LKLRAFVRARIPLAGSLLPDLQTIANTGGSSAADEALGFMRDRFSFSRSASNRLALTAYVYIIGSARIGPLKITTGGAKY